MKIKTIHVLTVCALTLLAAQPVWAAKKAAAGDLKVTGTITPEGCKVVLPEQGVLNYGDIAVDQITNNQKGTELGASAEMPLQITCNAPTQVALGVVDMRPSSRVDGLTLRATAGGTHPSTSEDYGLGMQGNHRIGAYRLFARKFSVDGNPAEIGKVRFADLGVLFALSETDLQNNTVEELKQAYTWVKPNGRVTLTGSNFETVLQVSPVINKSGELDLASQIKFDGQAALTVYYL